MSYKVTTLQKRATAIALNLGHKLIGWDEPFDHNRGRGMNGKCVDCKREVHVRTKPQPNEIDLAGAAIAENCDVTSRRKAVIKRHAKRAKATRPLAKSVISQASIETRIQAYAVAKERADEAMFRLCIHIYEQIEDRDAIAAAVRQVRGCSFDESHRIATRLHRMAHDKDAMDDLINGTQPIAYRATMRKAVL